MQTIMKSLSNKNPGMPVTTDVRAGFDDHGEENEINLVPVYDYEAIPKPNPILQKTYGFSTPDFQKLNFLLGKRQK
jgi:hypothetical protein